MNQLAKYCVIEVQPNLERREVVNAGILVRFNGRWDVRVATDVSKLRALNPAFPEGGLTTLAITLTSILQSADNFSSAASYLRQLGGGTSLQEFVGQFPATKPAQYEEEIAWLMADLVIPPALNKDTDRRVAPEHRLRTKLRKHFKQKRLLGKRDEINDHKVVEKFPIEAGKGLFAEFALKNSCMHITETVDFDVSESSERNKRLEAQAKTLILSAAKIHLGDSTKTYVVVSGSNRKAAKTSINLLEDYAEVFALESADDMDSYFKRIYTAANASQNVLKSHQ